MACGKSTLTAMVRASNVVVLLLGAALLFYGIAFGVMAHAFGVAAAVPLVLGLLDIAFGTLMVVWCYERLFFLRLYTLINGLIWIGEFIIAILFLVPATQQRIIDSMNLEGGVLSWVQANIAAAGYILIAVMGGKGVAVALVVLQSCARTETFDEHAHETGTAKLLGTGATAERDGESTAAADRYRSKQAAVYDRYNIRR